MAREILSFPIVPRHKLEKSYRDGSFKKAWNAATPPREIVGCGPFVLRSYEPGKRLVYERNPHFWKRDQWNRPLPYLAKFERLIVEDYAASRKLLLEGQLDVRDFSASAYPYFKAGQLSGRYGVRDLGPSWHASYLVFNQNPDAAPARVHPALISLFGETQFRRAVSHAINRGRIIQKLYHNRAEVFWSPVTPANSDLYNPDVPEYSYNLAEARRLLAKLGLRDPDGNGFLEREGREIRFTLTADSSSDAQTSLIAADLRAIGLNVTVEAVDFSRLVTRLSEPDYDWQAVVIGLGLTSGPEPYEHKTVWLSSGKLHLWYPRQNRPATDWEAEIDQIFQQAARETDDAKRRELYRRWQVIAATELPFIFLPSSNEMVAVRPGFGNLRPCSLGGVLWNLEELFSLDAKALVPVEM